MQVVGVSPRGAGGVPRRGEGGGGDSVRGDAPSAPPKAPSLRDRLAQMLFSTALTISPVQIPFPRLDPSPPPAAVLPIGEPTPGIGVWRG